MPNLSAIAADKYGGVTKLDRVQVALYEAIDAGGAAHLPGKTVRAEWLSWIVKDRDANAAVGGSGIRLTGDAGAPVAISGAFDVAHARIPYPMVFEQCAFEGAIDLSAGAAPLLSFSECRMKAVNLKGSAIGWLILRDCDCSDAVMLTLARLDRGADFSGTHVQGRDGIAIDADWLRASGPVIFDRAPSKRRVEASGQISLEGAVIEGELSLHEARVMNAKSVAVDLEQSVVKGRVSLRQAEIDGLVFLVGAEIQGDFSCTGATLREGRVDEERKVSFVLIADHAHVKGSVYLRGGLSAVGAVRLYGVTIDRDLECQHATFSNPGAVALSAEGAHIDGDVQFANVDRRGPCRIDGVVNLKRAVVKGTFVWQDVEPVDRITLLLQSAKVTTLADRKECWPKVLEIDNFEYDFIANGSPVDAGSRAQWLRDAGTLRHEAYDRLASVLRRQGLYADSREIMYRKEHRHAREAPLTLGDRWWYGYGRGFLRVGFGPLAGYGYRLTWAFAVMLLTIATGAILFYLGNHAALMAKNSEHAPEFQSLLYALDVFVPIVDFGQGGAWIPDANKGTILASGFLGDFRTGGALLAVYWVEIALGWCVSSILVGTITARLARD